MIRFVQGYFLNLTPVPSRTPDEIRRLVEIELWKIANQGVVRGLRTFLIPPRLELRSWSWSAEQPEFPVWVIAESPQYDYGIAFSDYGFAPENSWGLIFLSHRGFDADYCWYSSLEAAYKDSRLFEEYEEQNQ